jgi:glycosyltransferase involved in cell wall biosynthesis
MTAKLGVICFKNWKFFKDIYDRLEKDFNIKSYDGYSSKLKLIDGHEHLKGFIGNRLVDKKKIDEVLKWSDVAFFEWASHFLEIGTHLPKRTPMVARLHRFEIFNYAKKIDWSKLDKLVLVSNVMRKWVLDRITFPDEKTVVIYNAINTDYFKPLAPRKSLTYKLGILGDVIPRKRVYELVLAFKELSDEIPEHKFRLSVAGKMEGEYPEFVKSLVERLDLKGRVALEGRVDDIVKWYNSIDIIVSNSMHESAHLTIQEGKACGCYPIAHWWDGADEFLSRDLLYYTNAEFIERVRTFYEQSEARRQSLRKQWRDQVVNDYSLPKTADKFKHLFQSLV